MKMVPIWFFEIAVVFRLNKYIVISYIYLKIVIILAVGYYVIYVDCRLIRQMSIKMVS